MVNPETQSKKISLWVRFEKSFVVLKTKMLSQIKINTNYVLTANPVSEATFFKPAFAITEVKPAKIIAMIANN